MGHHCTWMPELLADQSVKGKWKPRSCPPRCVIGPTLASYYLLRKTFPFLPLPLFIFTFEAIFSLLNWCNGMLMLKKSTFNHLILQIQLFCNPLKLSDIKYQCIGSICLFSFTSNSWGIHHYHTSQPKPICLPNASTFLNHIIMLHNWELTRTSL